MGPHKHSQRAIIIALLASLALWNLPFGAVVLFPFKLLATWMHELSHGLIMLGTGAGFDRMEIYRDTSGLAFARYSVGQPARAAIAAAGYMGTPLFGAIIVMISHKGHSTRIVLAVLGMLMAASAILFVANPFGRLAASVGAVVCFGVALLATERMALLATSFIAMQACINALLDIRVLFRTNLVVNGKIMGASDAHNMAKATFGTPALWAGVWLVWSLVLLFIALRLLYVRQQRALTTVPQCAPPAPPPAVAA